MKKISINIPNPCTENWDLMTRTEQGRHCASCNKVVIDFSGMTHEQIIHILLEQKGKKVCGNFYNTQINQPLLHIQKRSFPKWPAIAAMVVAGLFYANGNLQAQQHNTRQLYGRELAIEKNPQDPTHIKTEPAADSLNTYTIQVLSRESMSPIPGANVNIRKLGVFTSDFNGNIQLNIDPRKIPAMIHLVVSASGYEPQEISIQRKTLKNAGNIQLYLELERPDKYMMRGDVDINYNGN